MQSHDLGILLFFFPSFLSFKLSDWLSKARRQGVLRLNTDVYLLLLVLNFRVPLVVNFREWAVRGLLSAVAIY